MMDMVIYPKTERIIPCFACGGITPGQFAITVEGGKPLFVTEEPVRVVGTQRTTRPCDICGGTGLIMITRVNINALRTADHD